MDDSDDSEIMPQRYVDMLESGCSVTGSEASLVGEVMNARTIPMPGWSKIMEGKSDQSGASTYTGDDKMGRAKYVRRGRYAMGASIKVSYGFLSHANSFQISAKKGSDPLRIVMIVYPRLRRI